MRKVLLLGASALALGVGSNAAFAEDPLKITLSGTGQEWFGYATNDKDSVGTVSKTFMQSNNSFGLNGSTKLDNGITVGVSLSMNASPGAEGGSAFHTAGSHNMFATSYGFPTGSPETNFVTFSGGFGQITAGATFNAAFSTSMDAPSFGVGGLSWGRWAGWVLGGTGNNLNQGSGQVVVYDDYVANKIMYATPQFMGAQITASFTPNMSSTDSGASGPAGWSGDSSSVALTWGGDLGSAKVKAQVAYTDENFNQNATLDTAAGQYSSHLDGYSGGLSVSAGGFSIGGAVADRAVKTHGTAANAQTEKTNGADGITWDIGASYTTGPWGVAINYYTSQAASNLNTTVSAPGTGTSEDHYYGLDFQYTLGPGISIALENALVNYKATPGTNGTGVVTAQAAKNSGFFSVLSTTVNF